MDYEVLITDVALDDLRRIVAFIAQDDAVIAARVGNKLVDQALSLKTFPHRCGYFDQRRGIRKLVSPPYLVFFNVVESTRCVNILHLWHGARLPPQFAE